MAAATDRLGPQVMSPRPDDASILIPQFNILNVTLSLPAYKATICTAVRMCDHQILFQASATERLPNDLTPTLHQPRRNTSIAQLVKPPPKCSVTDCPRPWKELIVDQHLREKLQTFSYDIIPYVRSFGPDLFGCPVPPNHEETCFESLDFLNSVKPVSECAAEPDDNADSPSAVYGEWIDLRVERAALAYNVLPFYPIGTSQTQGGNTSGTWKERWSSCIAEKPGIPQRSQTEWPMAPIGTWEVKANSTSTGLIIPQIAESRPYYCELFRNLADDYTRLAPDFRPVWAASHIMDLAVETAVPKIAPIVEGIDAGMAEDSVSVPPSASVKKPEDGQVRPTDAQVLKVVVSNPAQTPGPEWRTADTAASPPTIASIAVATVSVGGLTFTASQAVATPGAAVIGSDTLSEGGPAHTIAGHTVQLKQNNVIVNGIELKQNNIVVDSTLSFPLTNPEMRESSTSMNPKMARLEAPSTTAIGGIPAEESTVGVSGSNFLYIGAVVKPTGIANSGDSPTPTPTGTSSAGNIPGSFGNPGVAGSSVAGDRAGTGSTGAGSARKTTTPQASYGSRIRARPWERPCTVALTIILALGFGIL